jgi:predicted nucleic acid-binding protein
MYLLDTDVLSELRKVKAGKAHPNVVAWNGSISPSQSFISVISVLEIERGILRLERRDKVQGEVMRNWFEQRVLPAFTDRVLAIDTAVARRCAGLHVPDPRPERDALIAATALVHSMTVVTRNVPDYEPTGVDLLNPWEWHSQEGGLQRDMP